jgi:hypothetical protein
LKSLKRQGTVDWADSQEPGVLASAEANYALWTWASLSATQFPHLEKKIGIMISTSYHGSKNLMKNMSVKHLAHSRY